MLQTAVPVAMAQTVAEMILIISLIAVAILAYANGANDNFKDVASFYGCRSCSYKIALGWATLATCAGSIASVFFASVLLKNFPGKGLVPEALVHSPSFLLAVTLAAGGLFNSRRVANTMSHKLTEISTSQGLSANLTTAMFVTTVSFHGLPVSTTHVSVGALLGMGTITGQAKWQSVRSVAASWVITLSCAALVAGTIFFFLWRLFQS
jgi:phosphate/sulfate permease